MFQSIRFKLTGFFLLLLCLTTLAYSLATIKILNQTILSEIIKRAETLNKSSAASVAYSLISGDSLGIDHIVFKGKSSGNDIEFVAVVDRNFKILAHSDIRRRGEILQESEGRIIKKNGDGTTVREISLPTGKIFEINAPVLFKGKPLGAIIVGVNQTVLLEAQKKAQKQIFWVLVVTFLVAITGILSFSVIITRPIKELASGVDDLKQSKQVKPLKVFSKDELGKLTEGFNRMSQTISDQQEEMQRYTKELEDAYVSIVQVLAVAIEARDAYTLGHSARVAAYSLRIGQEIGLKKRELEELEVASLFHDVGKLRTSDSILRKKQPLDLSEIRVIRHHPEDGAEILRKVKSLQKYVDPVRHHHEHYDGGGYPDGLQGDSIPLYSSIIAIADTFDAMTSTRPYRRAISKAEALRELKKGEGKQFHPILLKAFLKVMEESEENGENWPQPLESYMGKVV